MNEPPVRASMHAAERFLLRCPGVLPAHTPLPRAAEFIEREVELALQEGRRSCRPPRFLVGEGPRPRAGNGARLVWSDCQRRAYVVVKRRGAGWCVLTTLVPRRVLVEQPA
jgi:hypothetical protein